jgi:hypothetical protein
MTTNFLMEKNEQENQLVLKPLTERASYYTNLVTGAGSQQQLVFKGQEKVRTDTIRFERLLWHTTTCYGHCPQISLSINKNKQINFIGGKYADKQGYFKGKLTNTLYDELLEILRFIDLDKWTENDYNNEDAQKFTLEIYYNGKMKRISSILLPLVAEKLHFYLNRLPTKIELFEVKTKFEVKFSKY